MFIMSLFVHIKTRMILLGIIAFGIIGDHSISFAKSDDLSQGQNWAFAKARYYVYIPIINKIRYANDPEVQAQLYYKVHAAASAFRSAVRVDDNLYDRSVLLNYHQEMDDYSNNRGLETPYLRSSRELRERSDLVYDTVTDTAASFGGKAGNVLGKLFKDDRVKNHLFPLFSDSLNKYEGEERLLAYGLGRSSRVASAKENFITNLEYIVEAVARDPSNKKLYNKMLGGSFGVLGQKNPWAHAMEIYKTFVSECQKTSSLCGEEENKFLTENANELNKFFSSEKEPTAEEKKRVLSIIESRLKKVTQENSKMVPTKVFDPSDDSNKQQEPLSPKEMYFYSNYDAHRAIALGARDTLNFVFGQLGGDKRTAQVLSTSLNVSLEMMHGYKNFLDFKNSKSGDAILNKAAGYASLLSSGLACLSLINSLWGEQNNSDEIILNQIGHLMKMVAAMHVELNQFHRETNQNFISLFQDLSFQTDLILRNFEVLYVLIANNGKQLDLLAIEIQELKVQARRIESRTGQIDFLANHAFEPVISNINTIDQKCLGKYSLLKEYEDDCFGYIYEALGALDYNSNKQSRYEKIKLPSSYEDQIEVFSRESNMPYLYLNQWLGILDQRFNSSQFQLMPIMQWKHITRQLQKLMGVASSRSMPSIYQSLKMLMDQARYLHEKQQGIRNADSRGDILLLNFFAGFKDDEEQLRSRLEAIYRESYNEASKEILRSPHEEVPFEIGRCNPQTLKIEGGLSSAYSMSGIKKDFLSKLPPAIKNLLMRKGRSLKLCFNLSPDIGSKQFRIQGTQSNNMTAVCNTEIKMHAHLYIDSSLSGEQAIYLTPTGGFRTNENVRRGADFLTEESDQFWINRQDRFFWHYLDLVDPQGTVIDRGCQKMVHVRDETYLNRTMPVYEKNDYESCIKTCARFLIDREVPKMTKTVKAECTKHPEIYKGKDECVVKEVPVPNNRLCGWEFKWHHAPDFHPFVKSDSLRESPCTRYSNDVRDPNGVFTAIGNYGEDRIKSTLDHILKQRLDIRVPSQILKQPVFLMGLTSPSATYYYETRNDSPRDEKAYQALGTNFDPNLTQKVVRLFFEKLNQYEVVDNNSNQKRSKSQEKIRLKDDALDDILNRIEVRSRVLEKLFEFAYPNSFAKIASIDSSVNNEFRIQHLPRKLDYLNAFQMEYNRFHPKENQKGSTEGIKTDFEGARKIIFDSQKTEDYLTAISSDISKTINQFQARMTEITSERPSKFVQSLKENTEVLTELDRQPYLDHANEIASAYNERLSNATKQVRPAVTKNNNHKRRGR